jgi:hypothetical protein
MSTGLTDGVGIRYTQWREGDSKMGNRFRTMMAAGVAASVMAIGLSVAVTPVEAQDYRYRAPRTADGKPDLNGIWQALGSANSDIEPHAARFGPVVEMAALGAIPGGLGVVEGGEIPYLPEARAKQQENLKFWLERDPAVKCYMPGVPRATYMPYPFQIVQTPEYALLAYEFASASRIVYMDRPDFEAPVDSWMGHNIGRWEGETLVIDVTANMADTWLDSSGNHHSDQMTVEERYTAMSADHLMYEATITDPETYTRPWKISMPLYRRVETNVQLLEFKCVEFAEELMYGHLRKDPDMSTAYRASGRGSDREVVLTPPQ